MSALSSEAQWDRAFSLLLCTMCLQSSLGLRLPNDYVAICLWLPSDAQLGQLMPFRSRTPLDIWLVRDQVPSSKAFECMRAHLLLSKLHQSTLVAVDCALDAPESWPVMSNERFQDGGCAPIAVLERELHPVCLGMLALPTREIQQEVPDKVSQLERGERRLLVDHVQEMTERGLVGLPLPSENAGLDDEHVGPLREGVASP